MGYAPGVCWGSLRNRDDISGMVMTTDILKFRGIQQKETMSPSTGFSRLPET